MTIPHQRASMRKIFRTFLWMTLLSAVLFSSTHRVQASGTLISAPSRVDMVYDSARDLLYITDGGSVLRYHLGSNTFMTPFAIGGNLGGIDISPDGNTLVIADRRRLDPIVWVYVINLQTEQIQQVLFPSAFYEGGTYTVAYANDSTVLVTSTFEGSGWVPLRKLNPITGAWSEIKR